MVMVSVLDCVKMLVLLRTVATTQTGVGMVPEVTVVLTSPLTSDDADVLDRTMPPGALAGTRLKSTHTPAFPLSLLSTTLNFTTEFLGSVAAPAVLVPIIVGVAETNLMLLTEGSATLMVVLTEFPPVTEAVIRSVADEQFLSV